MEEGGRGKGEGRRGERAGCLSLPPQSLAAEDDSFPEPSPEHMLEFSLKVRCSRNPHAPKGTHDPRELYLHSNGEPLRQQKPESRTTCRAC